MAYFLLKTFFFPVLKNIIGFFWERGGVKTNTPNPLQLFSTVAPSKPCLC